MQETWAAMMVRPLGGLLLGAALLGLVACGGLGEQVNAVATQGAAVAATAGAAATQVGPAAATALAASGQAVGTARSLATQAAPAAATAGALAQGAATTARAAATQIAPAVPTAATAAAGALATVQTALTQGPAALPRTPVSVPGPGGPAPVQIVNIAFGLNPLGLSVTVQNNMPVPVDIGGWGLRVGEATARLPAELRLAPGASLTIHTASGTSSGSNVYLADQSGPLLAALRPGARLAVLDGTGTIVAEMALPG